MSRWMNDAISRITGEEKANRDKAASDVHTRQAIQERALPTWNLLCTTLMRDTDKLNETLKVDDARRLTCLPSDGPTFIITKTQGYPHGQLRLDFQSTTIAYEFCLTLAMGEEPKFTRGLLELGFQNDTIHFKHKGRRLLMEDVTGILFAPLIFPDDQQ